MRSNAAPADIPARLKGPPPPYLQVGDRLRHMFAISGSHPVGWARAVITIKTNATIAAEYEKPVKKKGRPRAS